MNNKKIRSMLKENKKIRVRINKRTSIKLNKAISEGKRISIPTIWNIKKNRVHKEDNLTENLKDLDVKIICPKCKGLMKRHYEKFFIVNWYVGFNCEECGYSMSRKEIYKEWGIDYRENIDLEVE